MNSPTYYARRYRTLYSPDALNFAAQHPRPAVAAVYSPAPTGIHCGLPRGATTARNSRILFAFIIPVALATGVITLLEKRLNQRQHLLPANRTPAVPSADELRRKQLLDAYGDRESLERLAEVAAIYEATR